MNDKKLAKALKLYARADLRAAQKQGSETIHDTAFGTLEVKYLKPTKQYRIIARIGDKTVDMGALSHREAEKVIASSYIVLQETPTN